MDAWFQSPLDATVRVTATSAKDVLNTGELLIGFYIIGACPSTMQSVVAEVTTPGHLQTRLVS